MTTVLLTAKHLQHLAPHRAALGLPPEGAHHPPWGTALGGVVSAATTIGEVQHRMTATGPQVGEVALPHTTSHVTPVAMAPPCHHLPPPGEGVTATEGGVTPTPLEGGLEVHLVTAQGHLPLEVLARLLGEEAADTEVPFPLRLPAAAVAMVEVVAGARSRALGTAHSPKVAEEVMEVARVLIRVPILTTALVRRLLELLQMSVEVVGGQEATTPHHDRPRQSLHASAMPARQAPVQATPWGMEEEEEVEGTDPAQDLGEVRDPPRGGVGGMGPPGPPAEEEEEGATGGVAVQEEGAVTSEQHLARVQVVHLTEASPLQGPVVPVEAEEEAHVQTTTPALPQEAATEEARGEALTEARGAFHQEDPQVRGPAEEEEEASEALEAAVGGLTLMAVEGLKSHTSHPSWDRTTEVKVQPQDTNASSFFFFFLPRNYCL